MGATTAFAASLGLYRLLPAGLRAAVESTAKFFLEEGLEVVASGAAARLRGSAEARKIQRCLARAIAFTLAKHRELNLVAFTSDFRRAPLADEVLRVLTDPGKVIDPERVRAAFAASHYDLAAIGLDGVELLQEIRDRFAKELQSDPITRAAWHVVVSEVTAKDVAYLRAELESRQAQERAASPLLTAEEFFAPWRRPGRLFTHAWTLVGRTEALELLVNFGRGKTQHRVAILPGRGGIGKSRLLLAATGEVDADARDLTVRVAADGHGVSADDLARLPAGPALVVIDDAHRRDDLELILAVAVRRVDPTRVLIATRPYGSDAVRSTAARVGFDPSELLILDELTDLEDEDRVTLARQALGQAHAHLAEALADATQDSPLVTVVGGRLLAAESVAPGLLSQHADFRDAVLGRMADDYVNALGDWIAPTSAARILELIAAIGPVVAEDDGLVEDAAAFLELHANEIRRALGEMEAAGILLRRGRALRVTPDVLADYLYQRASVSGGLPTGYAARVYSTFVSRSPASVLGNLAELDWRARQAEGSAIDLLGAAWTTLVEDFLAASYYGRTEILALVERVASFQPQRVLELIDLAIETPATQSPPEPKLWGHDWSQIDVLHKLPPLLRRIAYHPEYRRKALEHLWRIGRSDARELHQHPDHGIRTLAELAGYDSGRLDIAASVLAAIHSWLNEPDVHDHAYSVLDIIDPILEKAGSRMRPEGHQIVFAPYFVDPDSTRGVRDSALQVIEACLAASPLHGVLRAIKSLGSALRDPLGHFGSTPPDDLLERWTPEQLGVIERLGTLAADGRDPLVTLAVLEAVSWHASHGRKAVLREAARNVAHGVEWDFDLLLTKHLTERSLRLDTLDDGSDDDSSSSPDQVGPWERREARRGVERRRIADECVARWPVAGDGARGLNERLQTVRDAGEATAPEDLLAELARRHADYGLGLARICLGNGEQPLAFSLHALLAGLIPSNPQSVLDLTTEAAQSPHPRLRSCAAAACGHAMHVESHDKRYVGILRTLINDQVAAVRWRSVHALAVFARHHGLEALDVAMDVELDHDAGFADELFSAVSMVGSGDFQGLDTHAVRRLLEKLVIVDDLGQHWIGEFLDHASEVAPGDVVQLIIGRASSGLAEARPSFRVMPYRFESNFDGFGKAEGRADLLRQIRELSLNDGDHPLYWLPELYSAVSGGFDEIGLAVLEEWVNSGDRRRIEAAADLVGVADCRFVFEHPGFAINLLQKGAERGPECLKAVGFALHRSVGTRDGTGTPGEPMPSDVEARDSAKSTAATLREGSVERAFFESVAAEADVAIRAQLAWDAELA